MTMFSSMIWDVLKNISSFNESHDQWHSFIFDQSSKNVQNPNDFFLMFQKLQTLRLFPGLK